MKKFFVTAVFILAFASYSLYQYFDVTATVAYVAPSPSASSAPVSIPTPPPVISTKKTTLAPVNQITTSVQSSQPAPPPVPAVQKNLYADGTYTGNVANAYYGNIQVQAIIQNGKITDVQFLQYPSDRSYSRSVNGMAMPRLKSEAISAQSANVNIVSGATDSSQAFQQSLSSALAQAVNS